MLEWFLNHKAVALENQMYPPFYRVICIFALQNFVSYAGFFFWRGYEEESGILVYVNWHPV